MKIAIASNLLPLYVFVFVHVCVVWCGVRSDEPSDWYSYHSDTREEPCDECLGDQCFLATATLCGLLIIEV